MKFKMDRKALIKLIKVVNHRDFSMTGHMEKNRWLRIAACAGQVGLSANGVAGTSPAEILEEGVCFIWYGKLLQILKDPLGTQPTFETATDILIMRHAQALSPGGRLPVEEPKNIQTLETAGSGV